MFALTPRQRVAALARFYQERFGMPVPTETVNFVLGQKDSMTERQVHDLLDAMIKDREIRFVRHDYLANGYEPVAS